MLRNFGQNDFNGRGRECSQNKRVQLTRHYARRPFQPRVIAGRSSWLSGRRKILPL